jgi:hypothetical protein
MTAAKFRSMRLAEGLLALGVLAGIVWVAASFAKTGYLPQPFIFDTNDTFMDWFNTAYWTHHPGAYSVWRTVYPPLSFAFLKLTSIGACYRDSPFWARDCDGLSRAWILGFFVLNVWIVWRAYRADDPATAVPRTIAMALGLPMLFALERGNLILPCFTAFALAYGRLLKQAWARWIAVAVTVNFKPYLILACAPYLVRRRWRWLEGCAFAILGVYLVTYVITGAGSPMEIYDNTRNWVRVVGGMFWGEIYYSTSFATLSAAMNEPLPLLTYLDSKVVDLVATGLPLLVRGGQAVVALTFLAAAFRPTVLSHARLGALAMAFILTSQSPGGYAEVFLLFLVFFERAAGPASIVALICAYLLCIPADLILITISQGVSPSWLSHQSVYFTFGLSVGQFARPALMLGIEYALAIGGLAALFGGVLRPPAPARPLPLLASVLP